MFYCTEILSKKGKLGLIWIAANFDGAGSIALTKREYFSVNIMKICDEIMEPSRPYALRLSSKLLLGISRVFSKQMYYLLVDLRHVWETIKKKDNEGINLPPTKAKNRSETVTMQDPFAHFNAWLLSNTADILNMSISDFEFPSESEFQTISDSQTADLRDITLEEEDFLSCSTSMMDDDDNFGEASLQFDNQHENEQPTNDVETGDVYCDPHNDSVLLYDKASGSLRQLEEAPLVTSPAQFVLEELASEHVQQPLRHRRLHNHRIRRDKERVLSDTDISDRLRTPECLLQSKEHVCRNRTKPKELFNSNYFSVINKGAFHLEEIWKRNASVPKNELFDYPVEMSQEMEDGSESSVEILRGQYSMSTASYEESREGLSQLTPVNDQSSLLLSTQGSYEFEMTSTQSRHNIPYQPVAPVGNLSPIMDEPEFDMDIGDISLPSLNDSDIESDSSVTSTHTVQLHDALREVAHTMEGREDIDFSSLLRQPCLRKTAAKRFSQLLDLATKQVLHVHQDVPYGDITISRGPEF